MTDKNTLISALRGFINSRPGFDPANYAGVPDVYRADVRAAIKDRNHALALLRYVELSHSINVEDILRGLDRRLTWNGKSLDYCVCQYYPTEYRKAAASALASVIWDWLRDKCNCTTSDKLRINAKFIFGRAIASRYFN